MKKLLKSLTDEEIEKLAQKLREGEQKEYPFESIYEIMKYFQGNEKKSLEERIDLMENVLYDLIENGYLKAKEGKNEISQKTSSN